MTDDFLNLLSDSRTRLVQFIKTRGDVSVDEAVEALGLAGTTIRQHVDRLLALGLLETESVVQGPGRPTLRYRLSANGRRLFPSQDGRLLGKVLEFMVQQGYPSLVNDFFEHTWEQRAQELEEKIRAAGLGEPGEEPEEPSARAEVIEKKLKIVADFLAAEGFMPELQVDDGQATVSNCNCPFPQAVRATRLPCRLEAQLYERVFGRKIARTGYIPDGDPACVYEFDILRPNPFQTSPINDSKRATDSKHPTDSKQLTDSKQPTETKVSAE